MRRRISYRTDVAAGRAAPEVLVLGRELEVLPLDIAVDAREGTTTVSFEVEEQEAPLIEAVRFELAVRRESTVWRPGQAVTARELELARTRVGSGVSLRQTPGFPDLLWPPMNVRRLWLSQVVILDGPGGRGAVGRFDAEHRLSVSARPDPAEDVDPPGFMETEPTLSRALDRLLALLDPPRP